MNLKVSSVVLAACLLSAATYGIARAEDSPAYTIEDVTACSADAMRLCRSKMPDLAAIEDCMKEHYEQLRPRCRARFDKDR